MTMMPESRSRTFNFTWMRPVIQPAKAPTAKEMNNAATGEMLSLIHILNVETIKLCNRYRVPMLPGVMTPSEAITAMEAGCDIIKIFPGNIVGPAAISSFKGDVYKRQHWRR